MKNATQKLLGMKISEMTQPCWSWKQKDWHFIKKQSVESIGIRFYGKTIPLPPSNLVIKIQND